jgi:hypothetical protein
MSSRSLTALRRLVGQSCQFVLPGEPRWGTSLKARLLLLLLVAGVILAASAVVVLVGVLF